MIIWLASYPRSGNSLCRRVLHKVFDVYTYSKHNSRILFREGKETNEILGYHRWPEANWSEAYARMKDAPEVFFVKTHDAPEDDAKAIYIVRDGRAASCSYKQFFNNLHPEADVSLWDIIAGFATYGSWGSHLSSWTPQKRSDTLVVRYEDMMSTPDREVQRIAEFCGMTPVYPWENDFDDLHRIHPRFFRRGKTSVEKQIIPQRELDLFWWLHSHWMLELDYVQDVPKLQTPEFELAQALSADIARKSTFFYNSLEAKEEAIQSLLGFSGNGGRCKRAVKTVLRGFTLACHVLQAGDNISHR